MNITYFREISIYIPVEAIIISIKRFEKKIFIDCYDPGPHASYIRPELPMNSSQLAVHAQSTPKRSEKLERSDKMSDAMWNNNPTNIVFVMLSLSLPIRAAIVESGLPRTRNEVKRIYIH